MLDRPTFTEPTLADVMRAFDDVMRELKAVRELVEQRVGDTISVPRAAVLVRRSEQTVRNWCKRRIGPVGEFDKASRVFRVSKSKLRAYLLEHAKPVPPELE